MNSGPWEDGKAKNITFVVTKDCQLACKYCYLVGKNANERMMWDTAKEAVDFVLRQRDESFQTQSVVFDFIGGEPFLEIDLIDRICDYIKRRMYEMNHPWFNLYRFSFSTNGINYHTDKVQRFIHKNHMHLSIGITIDGTKQKHDLNRVWRDTEQGSYDAVVANIPLWLSQFPLAATKVTISSPDIPYVCDSVIHLFSLGIRDVNINCVFEDVWHDGDDLLFEQQLVRLADRMIDEGYVGKYFCSFFDRSIGRPVDPIRERSNWCGSGRMLAIDTKGNLFPCNRFVDFSLRSKPARSIGSLSTGLDKNRLRAFECIDRTIISSNKCINCDIASGCAWCLGENYDSAQTPTIYQRATAICKMHAARVRANRYFWQKLGEPLEEPRRYPEVDDHIASLGMAISTFYIMLDSATPSICGYSNDLAQRQVMQPEVLQSFAHKIEVKEFNGERKAYYGGAPIDLVVVVPPTGVLSHIAKVLEKLPHKLLTTSQDGMCTVDDTPRFGLLSLSFDQFYDSLPIMGEHLQNFDRLNVQLYGYEGFDTDRYREACLRLKDMVVEQWKNGHKVKVNLVTDPAMLRRPMGCVAGTKSITLAPDGNFYLCPAFYYDSSERPVGSVNTGFDVPLQHLLTRQMSPVCNKCGRKACSRCIYENKRSTLEVNVPSYEQCAKSSIDVETCQRFVNEIRGYENINSKIDKPAE